MKRILKTDGSIPGRVRHFSLVSPATGRRFSNVSRSGCFRAVLKPEDVARLSPLADKHFNMLGRYHFIVTDSIPRGDLRPLRDPDPQKNSFGQPDRNVRFGSKDSGTPDSKTIE